MGRVKDFAFNLARCVYELEMSDIDILTALRAERAYDEDERIPHWLKSQIEAVRNNPELYDQERE